MKHGGQGQIYFFNEMCNKQRALQYTQKTREKTHFESMYTRFPFEISFPFSRNITKPQQAHAVTSRARICSVPSPISPSFPGHFPLLYIQLNIPRPPVWFPPESTSHIIRPSDFHLNSRPYAAFNVSAGRRTWKDTLTGCLCSQL